MRNELTKGTVLHLTADDMFCEISISQTIGQGANCLVYEGEILSGFAVGARCRIKECYPSRAEISRNGSQIAWGNTYQRDKAFDRFKAAHSLIISLRNEDTLGNNITNAGLFYGNGTIYSVMEMNYGTVDEQNYTENLSVLFEEVRVLCDVIGRLHENGYLHLDIKPQNYLVSYSPNVSVWLFDVDSISPLEELRSGTAQISYTAQWAAPESFLGYRCQLAPATDLYSIGAVLFEKIMGRPVQEEDTRPWVRWNFDNTGFNNVNPLVFKKLGDIFRKTLSVSIEDRYQNAGELSEALAEIRDLAKKQPYLKPSVLSSVEPFLDREDRIKAIDNAFSSGKRIVFVEGMPGIGKTELVKRYALLHQKDYDVILFSRYPGSIEHLFADVDIRNFEGTIQEKESCLKNLLSRSVLWVIDGFDDMPTNGIEALRKIDCHILLSGSVRWEKYLGEIPCVVAEMPFEFQLQLFAYAYGSRLSASERKIAAQIVSAVKGHTLSILLLAKQIRRGFIGLDEALSDLHRHGFVGTSGEWIRYEKDGKLYYEELAQILEIIFDIEGFLVNNPDSQRKASVLRNLAMFNNFKVKTAEFADWMGAGSKRYINELIETYWIHEERIQGVSYLSMHAVVAELVSRKLGCSHDLCPEVFAHIQVFANDFSAKYKTPVLERELIYGRESVLDSDAIQLDSYISLISQYLNMHVPTAISEIVFWIDIIEKLCCRNGKLAYHADGIWNFLQTVWNNPDLRGVAGPVAEVKIATSFVLISMVKECFSDACTYLRDAFSLLDSLPNGGHQTAFRIAYSCYTLWPNMVFGKSGAKEDPAYSEFSGALEEMWQELLAHNSGEAKVADITYSDIWNIYNDFLFWAYASENQYELRLLQVALSEGVLQNDDCKQDDVQKIVDDLCDQIASVSSNKVCIDSHGVEVKLYGSLDEWEKTELKRILTCWKRHELLLGLNSCDQIFPCVICTRIYGILLFIAVLIDEKNEIENLYSTMMHCEMHTAEICQKAGVEAGLALEGAKWFFEAGYLTGAKDLAFQYTDELLEKLDEKVRAGAMTDYNMYTMLRALFGYSIKWHDDAIGKKYRSYIFSRFSDLVKANML